jgi:hypothetical protein
MPVHDWDADQELAKLEQTFDASTEGVVDERKTSERLFREALPSATLAVIHMARYSENEQIRFKAATYVVERNLGTLQQASPLNSASDPLTELLGELAMIPETAEPAYSHAGDEVADGDTEINDPTA